MAKILYMVVPCYNEEAVLTETSTRLHLKFEKLISDKMISSHSKILFVNDGSTDRTWAIGGLQLLAIGVIGEYIGKIYLETKARPRFIIDEILLDGKENG